VEEGDSTERIWTGAGARVGRLAGGTRARPEQHADPGIGGSRRWRPKHRPV